MKRRDLLAGLLSVAASLAFVLCATMLVLGIKTAMAAPVVELHGPPFALAGQPFDVVAEVSGCSPKQWAWSMPEGGSMKAEKARLTASCAADQAECMVEITLKGGGCAGASQRLEVALFTAEGVECCGDRPGGVLRPLGKVPVYYQPSDLSTGRLDVQLWGGVCRRCS